MSLKEELSAHRDEHIIDLQHIHEPFTRQELTDFISLIELNRNIGYIQFSERIYEKTKDNQELQDQLDLIKRKLIDNIYSFNTFPSDYVHCLLTKLTYNFNEESKIEILSRIEPGWRVIETKKNVKNSRIYCSKIYKNNNLKQLILIFQGFKFNHIDFISRIESLKIFNREIISNHKKIKEVIRNDLAQAVAECKANQLSLSFSGYSFGAWFAVQCLYLCHLEYPNMNAKAVLFESAGSFELLKHFCSKLNKSFAHETLNNYDIRSYLSEPNFFNSTNQHVGNQFVFSNDPDNEIEFFAHLIDDKSKVFNLKNLKNLYIDYKEKLLSIRDSYESDYNQIYTNKANYRDYEEAFSNNLTDTLSQLKEHYKNFSFYVSGIESLTENRLKEISNQFDPETQRIEHLRQVKKWPIVRTTPEPKIFENEKVFYFNTLINLKSKIEEFKKKSNLNFKVEYEYESEEINKFEISIAKPKGKEKTTNQYLFQLATISEYEINSTFPFIRNHLIHLKTLFDTIPMGNNNECKIKSNEPDINIETIKRVLERLIYIDKHLQLKFGIINDYKDYDLMTNSNHIESSNEKLLYNFDYKCGKISKYIYSNVKKRQTILRCIEEREEIKHLLEEAKSDLERKIKENQIYIDSEFKDENASLFNYQSKELIIWLRPNEIKSLIIDRLDSNQALSKPISIFRSPRVAENYQGDLGDCWLIAALTSLTQHTYFLDEIFLHENNPKYQNIELGFYQLKFCIRGKWTVVSIDDRLPCHLDNTFCYANTFTNQLWTSLIEKAYAKANMNYESICSGFIAEGFASEIYELNSESKDYIEQRIYNSNLWKIILRASERNYLMGCDCFIQNDFTSKQYELKNLPINHSYTILKTIELSHHKLILLKNPQGIRTWNGRWSQRPNRSLKKSKWTSDKIAEFRENYPDLPLDELYEKGIFWISFKDLSKYFLNVTICDFKEQFYVRRLYDQEFYNARSNHFLAYDLEINQFSTSVYIQIFNSRIAKRYDPMQSDLGFIVLKRSNELFCHSNFAISSYVSKKLLLPKGVYRIIPISFRFWNALQDDETNRFNLVVLGSNRFNLNVTSLEICHLPEIVFKILPLSRSSCATTKIIDDVTFVYAYNEKAMHFLNVETKVTADVTECKQDDIIVEKAYNSSEFTRSFNCKEVIHVFNDIVKPRSKRIILITVMCKMLKFDHNYKKEPTKKYKFDYTRVIIRFNIDSNYTSIQTKNNIDALHCDIPI